MYNIYCIDPFKVFRTLSVVLFFEYMYKYRCYHTIKPQSTSFAPSARGLIIHLFQYCPLSSQTSQLGRPSPNSMALIPFQFVSHQYI